MAHPFLVKDIAFQAGLSTATVDRVLNGRRGVRQQTVMRVNAAIRELERQQAGLEVQGRKYAVDVVMEAPERFTEAVRKAFESEAATFMPTVSGPASISPRPCGRRTSASCSTVFGFEEPTE